MEKVKIIVLQTMFISFGILLGLSFESFCYREEIQLAWYHPVSIVLAGLLCSFPTLLLTTEKELPKSQYRVRIFLHFLALFAFVMGFGYLFRWYTMWIGALFVAGEFVFVYIFVWVVTTWLGQRDQKEINAALKDIQDEE